MVEGGTASWSAPQTATPVPQVTGFTVTPAPISVEGTDDDITITVTLEAAPGEVITVGVAHTGGDYNIADGTADIGIGAADTSGTATLPIEDDDAMEVNGRFTATVQAGTGYSLPAAALSRSITIKDDDTIGPSFLDPAVKGQPREWQRIWFDDAASNINHPDGSVRDAALADWEYSSDGATNWAGISFDPNPLQLEELDIGSYYRAWVQYKAGSSDDVLDLYSDPFGPVTGDEAGPEVESFTVTEADGTYTARLVFNENLSGNLPIDYFEVDNGDPNLLTIETLSDALGDDVEPWQESQVFVITVPYQTAGTEVELKLKAGSVADPVGNSGPAAAQTVTFTPPAPEVTIAPTPDTFPVTEGSNTSFTVSGNFGGQTGVTVNVAFTATGDFGVTEETREVTLDPGRPGTAAFTVSTTGDSTDETHGTVTATVQSGTGYTVGAPDTAEVQVRDNDAPAASIAGAVSVDEDPGAVEFTVTLTSPADGDITLRYRVAATGAFDVATGNFDQTIAEGGEGATISIAIDDDAVNEGPGSVTVTLRSGTGYTVDTDNDSATTGIVDDDEPTITIAAVAPRVIEGTAAEFTLSTVGGIPADADLTVNVGIAGGGAFGVSQGDTTGTILTGQTSITIEVATDDDSDEEGTTETITATLKTGTGYVIASSAPTASVIVRDNDSDGVTIAALSTEAIPEGQRVRFTVTAVPEPTSVLNVVVRFTGGESFGITENHEITCRIPIGDTDGEECGINTGGDSTDEPHATLTAAIQQPAGDEYVVGSPSFATFTVEDDDPPAVSVAAASPITEGNDAVFTFTLTSAPGGTGATLNLTVATTGEFGVTGGPETVSVGAAETSVEFTVSTTGDEIDQDNGTVTVTVRSATPSEYTVGSPSSATVAVRDDDNLQAVGSLEQLNAVRYDLNGNGLADDLSDPTEEGSNANLYAAAFPNEATVCDPRCVGYRLTRDLDFSGSEWADDPNDPADTGWEPIEASGTGNGFTAIFDGDGNEVRNLFINRPTASAGLFVVVGTYGEIRNLGLVDAAVTGGRSVGLLAGESAGTITASHAVGGSVNGDDHVGGLVGRNTGTIDNSYTATQVTGQSDLGGLAGFNDGSSITINGSYATGPVTNNKVGGTGTNTGGLAGRNSGTITASYATGRVIGDLSGTGGLVGDNNGTITAAYATGPVSGGSDTGGLAGHNGGTITASYFDTDASGQTAAVGGGTAAGAPHQCRVADAD